MPVINIKKDLIVSLWTEGVPTLSPVISIQGHVIHLSRLNIVQTIAALEEILRVGDNETKKGHKPEWNNIDD